MILFWRGLLIGLAIAAPLGPVGVLVLRRTLAHGRIAGLVSGLGAATVDAGFAAVAGFGLKLLADFLVQQAGWLRGVGGLFLIGLGVQTILARPSLPGEARAPARSGGGLAGMYFSALLLTLTNPLTILAFSAIAAGGGVLDATYPLQVAAWVAGLFSGSTLWWLMLSQAAGLFRTRLEQDTPAGRRTLRWVNRVAGMVLVIFGVAALLVWVRPETAANPVSLSVTAALGGAGGSPGMVDGAAESFARAEGVQPLVFPRDHGPHPDYQTEWWYYTGNLTGTDGQRYGYQLTFFRRALLPPEARTERTSAWAAEQVYMVHFALTDAARAQHFAIEQLSRGAAGLAGAQAVPFAVWLDVFRVELIGPDTYRLTARALREDDQPFALELELRDVQGPTLQGDQGYSQKGPQAGNASYYYSLARLETTGRLSIGADGIDVTGSSWMDHEYSTSALAPDQVGWDWFSIQMEDGVELMVFQIRKADGGVDAYSSGALIRADGSVLRLRSKDFEITVLDQWISPESEAAYPARWRVRLPAEAITLEITPLVADQELNVSYAYWEGAVQVVGNFEGQAVRGVGYVELTGYASSMAGEF